MPLIIPTADDGTYYLTAPFGTNSLVDPGNDGSLNVDLSNLAVGAAISVYSFGNGVINAVDNLLYYSGISSVVVNLGPLADFVYISSPTMPGAVGWRRR